MTTYRITRREAEADAAADLIDWAEANAPELLADTDEDTETEQWADVLDAISAARWAADHPHRPVPRSDDEPF